jgi:hypothetical protein
MGDDEDGDGARLRAAAEDLQLDGDAGEQRQHDAGGDHADGGLHRRCGAPADAVESERRSRMSSAASSPSSPTSAFRREKLLQNAREEIDEGAEDIDLD